MNIDINGIYYIFNTNIIGMRIHKNALMCYLEGTVWGTSLPDYEKYNGHSLFSYHYNTTPEQFLVRLK